MTGRVRRDTTQDQIIEQYGAGNTAVTMAITQLRNKTADTHQTIETILRAQNEIEKKLVLILGYNGTGGEINSLKENLKVAEDRAASALRTSATGQGKRIQVLEEGQKRLTQALGQTNITVAKLLGMLAAAGIGGGVVSHLLKGFGG